VLPTNSKQLNAPFGQFSMATLVASTHAIKGGTSSDDTSYTSTENQISSLTASRDGLAMQIRAALDSAAFGDTPLNEQKAKSWIAQANDLIGQAQTLAG